MITIMSVLSLSLSSCIYTEGVNGNGNVVEEQRDVASFQAVDAGGAFKIILSEAGEEALLIEADENLLPLIRTEVRNGVLKIYSEKNIGHAEALNIYIRFKNIERIDVSGAVDVQSKTPVHADKFRIKGSGASEIKLELITEMMDCDFSGASEIKLLGRADFCNISLSGASELHAYDFEVREMDLDISGAGEARVFVSEKLDAGASGAASVRYKGNPVVKSSESGASSIRRK